MSKEVNPMSRELWMREHATSRIHLLWQSVITLCFYLATPNPHMLHTPRLWFRPAMCNKPSHLWNPVGGCRWWRTLSTLGGLGVPHSQRDPVGRPRHCRSSLQINTSENFVFGHIVDVPVVPSNSEVPWYQQDKMPTIGDSGCRDLNSFRGHGRFRQCRWCGSHSYVWYCRVCSWKKIDKYYFPSISLTIRRYQRD